MNQEYRRDGWPLCPQCGEDELMSSRFPASAADPLKCLRCGWQGTVPEKRQTILGIPVRSDATLCDPNEVWFGQPDGTVTRIWPPRGDHDA